MVRGRRYSQLMLDECQQKRSLDRDWLPPVEPVLTDPQYGEEGGSLPSHRRTLIII